MINTGYMGGIADSQVGTLLADAMNSALQGSGDPNSQAYKDRAQFYSDVLAQSGDKFLALPNGQAMVSKLEVGVALPALLFGLAAGWWLASRRRA